MRKNDHPYSHIIIALHLLWRTIVFCVRMVAPEGSVRDGTMSSWNDTPKSVTHSDYPLTRIFPAFIYAAVEDRVLCNALWQRTNNSSSRWRAQAKVCWTPMHVSSGFPSRRMPHTRVKRQRKRCHCERTRIRESISDLGGSK